MGLADTILDNTEGFEYGVREQIATRMAGQISGSGSIGPNFVNTKIEKYVEREMIAAMATADARL